jgi:hypothetical protein
MPTGANFEVKGAVDSVLLCAAEDVSSDVELEERETGGYLQDAR